MSYVKIWIHCVWGTHRRLPFLTPDKKMIIISHIREQAKNKNIFIDMMNGYLDHLHCLISLGNDQSLSFVMQMIKGESSRWINNNSLTRIKFSWADKYYGVSVGQRDVDSVRDYIRNQEIHHSRYSWDDEVDELVKEYGFVRFYD